MDETMRFVVDLEGDVEALRVRYEQHFLGLARTPPTEEHARIRGHLLRLKGAGPRSAAVRFRLQALHNRFLSYERMWTRTLREREDGTYHRDLAKARRRREALLGQSEGEAAPAEGAPRKEGGGGAGATPRPARKRRDADLSDVQMRSLYDAYVGAKNRCNESTAGLTFEGMASRLRNQIPQILEKHQAKAVEFKVLIKDGKAMIKAIPKGK